MSIIESWFEEKQSAWLYRAVAQAEQDAQKNKLFTTLADAAESQALLWERRIREKGDAVPVFHPSLRARLVRWLIQKLGPRTVRPVLAAMKVRGVSVYGAGVTGHPMPTSVAEMERRHKRGSGGNLRAAVFGVNDGLVSNTSLIMGVAGASSDANIILLSGVAGLLAGAFSMAAGEYVSMRSQRELFEYQIGLEREELAEYPEEEAEELALIYNARGLPLEEARHVARDLMRDPEHALNTLAREELGLNPHDLGSPWGAALSSFLAFAVGGVVPLLPFLLGAAQDAVLAAAALAGASLFAVGALLSLFTGKSAWYGGLRMVLIGGGAGIVTYLIGSVIGVSLS
ncbi:MAG: VIT1/CCC1 transporter family protein [Gammaproteobacteria bacterium]